MKRIVHLNVLNVLRGDFMFPNYDISIYIGLYASLIQSALPLAFVFGMGNVLCNMVYAAAFRGRLVIGAGR